MMQLRKELNRLSSNNANNQIHLTVKRGGKFAIANFPPLFTSSDFGVMSKNRLRTIVALIAVLSCSPAFACMLPQPGYGFTVERLIDESEDIYVIELSHFEKDAHGIRYFLKPVTVIKGKAKGLIEFWGSKQEHKSSTYFYHYNPTFWFSDAGRSDWSTFLCGPNHTFTKGFKYLFLPNMLGSMKSAEVINSNNDRWYLYVLDRVKNK